MGAAANRTAYATGWTMTARPQLTFDALAARWEVVDR
ncbi:putative protein OS=Streptomyces aurantiogriseus OX=66870 GN=GCM10010251_39980 PE=4 SV=1 [Streptomyces aurantiogriseus]